MGSNQFLAPFVFALAILGGFFVATTSFRGLIYVHSDYFNNGRNPAAIRRSFDFSHLEGSALQLASRRRLVTDAQVVLAESGMVGVELGHFLTRDDSGRQVFACEFYDRVSMRFEAEGVADGGEKPGMVVEGPCSVPLAEDLNRMAPIYIPVARIMGMPAADSEALTFPDIAGVQYKFSSVGTQWPRHWILQGIRLFNQHEPTRDISIGAAEMRKISSKAISIQF